MTSGKATPVPPKNGYLGLIADYYESRGEDAKAYATRHGTLDEAIRGLLIYLSNADATAAQADADAETAIQAARKAESDLASAVQPLAPEMARLNARVTEMNGHFDRLRLAAHEGVAALFQALRELPAGAVPAPTIKAPSFWGSAEVDAASRDFAHAEYLAFHGKTGCTGAPVSEGVYALIAAALNKGIEEGREANVHR